MSDIKTGVGLTQEIIEQNTAAINDFMCWHGENTGKEFSEFLFELQGMYLTRPNVSFTEQGASEVLNHFSLLYQLVNGIQAVEKDS